MSKLIKTLVSVNIEYSKLALCSIFLFLKIWILKVNNLIENSSCKIIVESYCDSRVRWSINFWNDIVNLLNKTELSEEI